jgi:hypothetical protein
MTALLFVAFVVFLGPMALWFGADSRDRDPDDVRGWWPAAQRPGLGDFGSPSTPASEASEGICTLENPADAYRRAVEIEALPRPT